MDRLEAMIHQQFDLVGIVQGVGFRPFVYRLAMDLNLKGWVQNSSAGVTIAVEGEAQTIAEFSRRLATENPPFSTFQIVEQTVKPRAFFPTFEIRPSAESSTKQALVLPDLATCPACFKDVFDPKNRRYRYPFTNCTYCGPRHSILLDLPYDRCHTTMQHFPLCAACQQEYDNPLDRRFHAQPNACPQCGPRLSFQPSPQAASLPYLDARDLDARNLDPAADPLQLAVEAIGAGHIVAIKGIGGFHLVCDATNESAVQTLRERKARPHKPFALMVKDLATAQQYCQISPAAAKILTAPQAPIVLLPRLLEERGAIRAIMPDEPGGDLKTSRVSPRIAPNVAPGNPDLGVMLPYSPLHHLLLHQLSQPIVATSGNRSDEPICIDNTEAVQRLGAIADAFLLHDRPIARPLDDSIVRMIDGQMMMLRRSRGYAPLPLSLPQVSAQTVLALGGHLKNTIAFSRDHQVLISPHLGDLDSVETLQRFETTIAQACQLYDLSPQIIVRDAHPDYASSQFADRFLQHWRSKYAAGNLQQSTNPDTSPPAPTIVSVQHHQAHLLAVWGEHPIQEPALGVIWDGTGYGTEGQIWGGEFFELLPQSDRHSLQRLEIKRIAHLRPFPLLGGDRAAREPRRSALGLLYTGFGEAIWDWTHLEPIASCTTQERKIFAQMLRNQMLRNQILRNQLNVPSTSSMGRLFDGVAAILGLFQRISFEGQAAQALEYLVPRDAGLNLDHGSGSIQMPLRITAESLPWQLDWFPLLDRMLRDLALGRSLPEIATTFHHSLISAILTVAETVGHSHIFLSGGCFQNLYLLQQTIVQLRQAGFTPHWPQQVPPNDGGIAFGQAIGGLAGVSFGFNGVGN